MSDSIDAALLDYYQRELTWLHRAGVDFSASHPTLAANLKLSPAGSQDPHVERLLESFALLAARLQRRLDDGYAEFSDALLEQLYPLILRPMPSCAIARFLPKSPETSLASGYVLPRGTSVFKQPDKAQVDSIYFRTCADLTLWPVQVDDVTLLDGDRALADGGLAQVPSSLCLELRCTDKKGWQALVGELTTLRIHLSGSPGNRAFLYDLLAAHSIKMKCVVPDGLRQDIDGLPVPVGFAGDEHLLPEEDGVHPGLRLLVEYFSFPEKFAFFDIPLSIPPGATDRLQVYIGFDIPPERQVSLQREDISLGCTPVINLFPRTAETLRPDGTQSEHRLVADSHRHDSTEIHSIQNIRATTDGQRFHAVTPYYGSQHGSERNPLFWHARRVSGYTPDRAGTELLLSLVDSDFNPGQTLPGHSFTAKVLCTNRHMAEQLPANTKLKFESSGPVAEIVLLKNPTAQSIAALKGSSRWRLVSQLNLNHASLVEGPHALSSLKEMLTLHNVRDDTTVQHQINHITGLHTLRVVDRVGEDAWRGWRNGLEVRLNLPAKYFAGNSRVLFSGVLAHFFALYANANGFIRTVLVDGDKEIKTWQPSSDPGLIL